MNARARERRRAPRVEERLPVIISMPECQVAAATRNLSSSGVYCELNRDMAPMSQVELAIELPTRRIRCEGVVVRRKILTESHSHPARYRLAIFFTHLATRDRQAIAQFVAERLAARTAANSSRHTDRAAFQKGALSSRSKRRWIGCVLSMSSLFMGCSAHLAVSRGAATKTIVDALGSAAAEGRTYTLRWLRRQLVDAQSQLRFDGVVVDLQGRSIQMLRREDGHHILVLQPQQSAAAPAQPPTSTGATVPTASELKIPAKELPTLQAVIRRYHFEPQLITDAAGVPQVVVYAPVPTRITVIHTASELSLCIDIQRMTGQPDRSMTGSPVGSLSGSSL